MDTSLKVSTLPAKHLTPEKTKITVNLIPCKSTAVVYETYKKPDQFPESREETAFMHMQSTMILVRLSNVISLAELSDKAVFYVALQCEDPNHQ